MAHSRHGWLWGLLLLLVPAVSSAAEQCFEVSQSAEYWSKDPELVCIEKMEGGGYEIRWKLGMLYPPERREVVTLRLDRITTAKCGPTCRSETYGIRKPESSTFNLLRVQVNGKRDPRTGVESGTILFGKNQLVYRSPK